MALLSLILPGKYLYPEESQNMVKNPGFEETDSTDANRIATGWEANLKKFRAAGGDFAIDEDVYHSGKRSLRINGSGGAGILKAEKITVRGDKNYMFSFWAKSDKKQHLVTAYHDFGKVDGMHRYTRKNFTVTDEWKEYSFKLNPPGGAGEVSWWFSLTPALWMDDMSVTEVPREANLENGFMTNVFISQAEHRLSIEYPKYKLMARYGGTEHGFEDLRMSLQDKDVFYSRGIILSAEKKTLFSLNRTPLMEFEETDEKGKKTISMRSSTLERLDYQGEIVSLPEKVSFNQQWTYKKPCQDVTFKFLMDLNPEVMEGAQYLITYADGKVEQGVMNLQLEGERRKILADYDKSFIKELVFYTGAGKIKYTISFLNIDAKWSRMLAEKNDKNPEKPNLYIVSVRNIEAGGETGETYGIKTEVEILN